MSYYPYIFTLKCHLRDINTEISLLTLLAWILEKNYYIFSTEQTHKKLISVLLVLLSQYLKKTWCNDFVLEKALPSLLFTQIIPAFNITTLLITLFYEFCIWKSPSIPTV